MRKLVILGAGTAGTIMANKLSRALPPEQWEIVAVDKDELHYYQPGFLFIPFGVYSPDEVVKPKKDFLPRRVELLIEDVKRIDPDAQYIEFHSGKRLDFDILIVATGARVVPEETQGLLGELWNKDIFDFYTFDGAVRLARKLEQWEGGRLVINLAESIIKCPVAPLEFAFLADSYFLDRGIRHKVEIVYVTPMPGAFTKPKATEMLSKLLEEKHIEVIPDFYLNRIDNERKVLVSYDEREVPFDLLVEVPVNKGSAVIEASGMGDEDGLAFVPTDKHTLRARDYENIFVIGDATNVPASKAGSVAHFEADILTENILSYIDRKPMEARFDGHANCFIETGHGKASLIDFNYDTEPLPGKFPFAGVGPLDLLKVNRVNHLGKHLFKWVYWHMLLTGKKLPISTPMSMAGKELEPAEN